MASSAKTKICDFKILKTFRGWLPMNFHGTTKLLQIVSHDLWARIKKLFSFGFEILGPAKCCFRKRRNHSTKQ